MYFRWLSLSTCAILVGVRLLDFRGSIFLVVTRGGLDGSI